MVKTLLSVSLVAISSLLAAVPAHAISFTWQFTPTLGPAATGGNLNVVKGTIDGLVIGSNSGAGITATVTSTPTGQLVGGGSYSFESTALGGDAFTVDSSGNVIVADARFSSTTGNVLFFGGFGGFSPVLDDNISIGWVALSGQTTFSSAPTAVPFDFSPTPAVLVLGGIFAAKKLRKKLVKK
ncbi:MAG: hypothetical protein WCP16_03350 [Pseudanabaena sp. ELA645]|jgi:hypothetical protein